MSDPSLASIVLAVLQRAPAWVRVDLTSTDATLRTRAEEVLATMIVSAIEDKGTAA